MTFWGRITASAFALGCGAAALAIGWGMQGKLPALPLLLAAGGLYLATALPAGWWLGYRYDRLKLESEQDGLTRVFNRRFVTAIFPKLVEQAARRKKRMSVTVIDINDFKEVNDQYGHQAGDQVLVMIADALRDCAAKGEIIARWGGDEFVLLCPYGVNRNRDALHATIRKSLEQLSLRIGTRVSASTGTAVYPEDGSTFAELLHTADQRMYSDKETCKTTTYETPHMLQA